MKALLSLVVLLSACADSNQNSAQDYAQRLANVLQQELPSQAEAKLNFPSRSHLVENYPQQGLSIREFMSMRQCKLHTIVANKNSQIGKVAPASQILFSDLQVLDYGPECVVQLKRDDQIALADKLDQYLASKELFVERALWQAILGSAENAKFWSRSNPINNYPNELMVNPQASIESLLKLIKDVQNNLYSVNPQRELEIEKSLQTLSYADGGLLLQRLSEINTGLIMADKLIEQAINKPICFNQSPNQKSIYLKNVVLKFFIGQVQQDLVDLLQRYQQLMPVYLEIEAALSISAPLVYQQWQAKRQALFEQAHDSAKRHVAKIQLIFALCGTQLN